MGGPLTGPSQEVTHATSPAVLQPESVQHLPRPGRSGNVGPGAERSAARQMTEGAPRPRRASAHAASASATPRRQCPGLRSRRRPPDRNRIGTGSSGRPARKSRSRLARITASAVSAFIGLILLFPFLRTPALIVSCTPPPPRG